jgi:hypothetical protein
MNGHGRSRSVTHVVARRLRTSVWIIGCRVRPTYPNTDRCSPTARRWYRSAGIEFSSDGWTPAAEPPLDDRQLMG